MRNASHASSLVPKLAAEAANQSNYSRVLTREFPILSGGASMRDERDEDARFSRYAESNIPTEYGTFRVIAFRERVENPDPTTPEIKEHLAIVKGDVRNKEAVIARVHSECLTGEVLHSMKCDCREQLDRAMRTIAKEECGVVFYLRQEGRGIGLGNKIRAYALQEDGADTVDANRLLGFPDDTRNFDIAAFMVRDLEIASLRLLTNNPMKVEKMRAEGIPIVRREGIEIEPNVHNKDYLRTKAARMGHQLHKTVDE